MGPLRAAVLVGAASVTSIMTSARGAVTTQEDFNDFSLGGAFEESSPGDWNYSAGFARKGSFGRTYVRTVATDYNTVDFAYEVTYTVEGPGGPEIAFVGFGNGTPGEFFGEPDQAIYIRHWPTAVEAGLLNLSRTSGDESFPGAIPDEETDMGNPGDGRHRAQITKAGGVLTFSLDEDYAGGPFVADYTTTRNLADSPWLDASNSRLFFGTESTVATFDDVSITVVPEPASLGLLPGSGALLLGRRRRAK